MQLNDSQLLKQQVYINGEWVDAANGDSVEILNPATAEVVGRVPNMGAQETRAAIEAADRAFAKWRDVPAKSRAATMKKWFELILENREDLAVIMTAEQGKPLAEARGEVVYGASFVEWFAEEGKRVYGETIPSHMNDRRIFALKQPVGVSAAITPWNFPNAMITRKCAPALAAGCTSVIKPAPQTPFSALALAELAHRAGIPAGVFSVVTGDAVAIGGEMTGNKTVRKLSFTGSTAVGKLLLAQCADTVKKVSMELGGHAPFIVFDDADIDAAVTGAIACKYRASGQTCVCANRLYVHDNVYDEFVEKFARASSALSVGNGTADGTDLGPLINAAAIAKVEDQVADAKAKGAAVLTGGERHELGGNFYLPTVLTNVTDDMKITYEETFGPVAPVMRFNDEADVIARANSTDYGLAAYLFTRDVGRLFRVSEALDFGIVGVNAGVVSSEYVPFGGVKQSGIGREGSHYGIEEYVEVKYLCVAGIDK